MANMPSYSPHLTSSVVQHQAQAAEFFAGIGLVRAALEQAGFQIVFANDIERFKRDLYAENFDARDFFLGDIRVIRGKDVPSMDLATASFPCTDLSLAGGRLGLVGRSSGLFWEFARVLREMQARRPPVVLVENVTSFGTSRCGEDLRLAIAELNHLGYICDILMIDAKWFVPQSRPRLFIIGSMNRYGNNSAPNATPLRPDWVIRFWKDNPKLSLQVIPLPPPPRSTKTLRHVAERLDPTDERWWDRDRVLKFTTSLSAIQGARLKKLQSKTEVSWATAYRRTRQGRAVWEIRDDEISGCLRTARGGSSKQAVVEAGQGQLRARWMTLREYARLQGAAGFKFGEARESHVLWGFGDAVCIPAVAWLAQVCLRPLVDAEVRAPAVA